MAVKRKTYSFRGKEIIEVEEYHDGRYGAPGMKRQKKKKATKEDIERVNEYNKTKRCRHRLLEYFDAGDTFATLTYSVKERPKDMKGALKDFDAFRRKVKAEFDKRGSALCWIRNIERGTKGAWHIHLVIKECGDTASIIKRAWKKGGVYLSEIRTNDKIYDADFSKLASYMTKSEKTRVIKKDGSTGQTRIRESSYSTSRNMPLPEPKTDKIIRWKRKPKPKKGYHIIKQHEGINPVTGFKYRRYTMVRYYRRE